MSDILFLSIHNFREYTMSVFDQIPESDEFQMQWGEYAEIKGNVGLETS